MPSIRDLKGRSVDDVVDSRMPMPSGSIPFDSEPVNVDKIREGVRAVEARRGRREQGPQPVESPILGGAVGTVRHDPERPRTPLPEDFEEGLSTLEREILEMEALAQAFLARASAARDAMEALRERAHKDAEKLAKFDALLKNLQG